MSRGVDTADWGMPGGNVEKGKSAAEAAARELWEETGLAVEPEDLTPIYRQAGCVTFVPRGDVVATRNPMSSHPFEGYVAWVPPAILAAKGATFGRLNRKMLRDLGIL